MNIATQKPIIFSLLFLFLTINLLATDTPLSPKKSLFMELTQQKYNEVTLTLDLDKLINQKPAKDRKKQAVQIRFKNEAGAILEMPVKISTRGVYRRQFCDFPPLKLDFSKRKLKTQGFIGQFDKYKLVTHCINSDDSDQTVLKEFAVYKMYNELTPASFRVHLIKIKYQDIHDENYSMNQLAFIIEENDEMANRLGGKLTEHWGMSAKQFTKTSFYNTMVFNYMIGNLDWSIGHQKNLKFVELGKNKPLILVPYDFDLCGIVAPEYFKLNSKFNQKSLADRFCKGKFENEIAMLQTVEKFQQLKSDFVNTYQDLTTLERKHQRRMTRYLASFYGILADEEELEEVFLAGKYEP